MTARCPVCDRPAVAAFKPFCGRGCQDRDLLRWLDGGYRLPGRRIDHDGPGDGLGGGLGGGLDKPDDAD